MFNSLAEKEISFKELEKKCLNMYVNLVVKLQR